MAGNNCSEMPGVDGESEIISRREECVHQTHPAASLLPPGRWGRGNLADRRQSFALMQNGHQERLSPSSKMLDDAMLPLLTLGGTFPLSKFHLLPQMRQDGQPSVRGAFSWLVG